MSSLSTFQCGLRSGLGHVSTLLCAVSLLSAFATAAPVAAATVLHTQPTSFAAATTGHALEQQGFEQPFAPTASLQLGKLRLDCGGCLVTHTNAYPSSGAGSLSMGGGRTLSLAFADPVTAVAFAVRDFGTLTRTSLWANVNGETIQLVGNHFGGAGNRLWFGLTSDLPISSLILSGGTSGDVYYLDDILFGALPAATDAVPEPANWALMITGFALVGCGLRRKGPVRASA